MIFLGYIGISIFEFVALNIFRKEKFLISGYRLHHSLYGLLFIIIGFMLPATFMIFLGCGIVLQHTVTDGFRFISKE